MEGRPGLFGRDSSTASVKVVVKVAFHAGGKRPSKPFITRLSYHVLWQCVLAGRHPIVPGSRRSASRRGIGSCPGNFFDQHRLGREFSLWE